MKKSSLAMLATASIFFPSLAFAQLSVCGTSPADIQQFGGFGVDAATMGAPAQMNIQLVPSVSNYLQFEVSTPTDLRIEATDDGGVDPVMVLLDAAGNEIASDDDGGGGRASRIEVSVDAGTYCARVYNFSSTTGPTTVQLGRLEHTPITPGVTGGGGAVEACTANTPASPLAFGAINNAVAGGNAINLNRTGDVTYHRFTVSSPIGLTITAANPDADPVVRVYDNAGNVVAENDDFDGLNSQIDMQTPLQAGDYCMAVSALSDGTQPIAVSIREFDEAAFLRARYDKGEASPPIGGDYPIDNIGLVTGAYSGDVLVGGVARWVSFEVSESSLMLIRAIGNGGADPKIYLYSERGEQLAFNDDDGSSLDSLIAQELFPGRYLIGILLYNYEEGTPAQPVRLSLQRYVRAQ